MLRLGILTVMLLLVGCEEHYRYPCQDPDNWQNEECQKPKCEVDGQCSSELTGGHSQQLSNTMSQENKKEAVEEIIEKDETQVEQVSESTNE